MTPVTVKNDAADGSGQNLSVMVVTVGHAERGDDKYQLAPQQQVQLHVSQGQFVMVDETDKEGS